MGEPSSCVLDLLGKLPGWRCFRSKAIQLPVSSPAQQLFDGLLSVINAFMCLERGRIHREEEAPAAVFLAKYREGLGDRQPGGLATVNHYRSVRPASGNRKGTSYRLNPRRRAFRFVQRVVLS